VIADIALNCETSAANESLFLTNQRNCRSPLDQGAITDANTTPASSASAVSALRGYGLMHGGQKGVVVKGFNEIGYRPGLYRRVPH